MESPVEAALKTKATLTTRRGRERAIAILNAARDTLASEGFAGLTVRAVAARACISLSNLQHYYATKEELIEALLEYMQDGYRIAISKLLDAHASSTPAERFRHVLEFLWDRVQDSKTATIFLEIWALSSRDGFFAAELVRKVRRQEHKAMLHLLQALPGASANLDLHLRASMVVLVMEGLLIQLAKTDLRPAARAELAAAAMRSAIRLASEAV